MTQAKMTTVELFAGIGGFRIAADAVGLKTKWANDVSLKASLVYKDRFGDAELREGDIREFIDEVPEHDILTAGFPCQPFSSAGQKKGFRDPRGHTFNAILEIVRTRRPRFFVLENVKRLLSMENGDHFTTVLAALTELGYIVEWRLLNAMHMGLAQNRQRVIIIGQREGGSPFDVSCIKMASGADLANLGEKRIVHLYQPEHWRCIGSGVKRYLEWGLAIPGRFFTASIEQFSDALPPVYLQQVLQDEVESDFDFTENTLLRIDNSGEVNRFYQGVEILFNQGGGARMGYTIFGTAGVAPTLTGSSSRHYERYGIHGRFRRLTNIEYARLQGFADDHCRAVSVYDQYTLFGNAVPPPLIKWAFERLLIDKPLHLPAVAQGNLAFSSFIPVAQHDSRKQIMVSKAEMRKIVEDNIFQITSDLNAMLRAPDVERLEPTLQRLGRGGQLPHWFKDFSKDGSLPNLDGKTVGSVIEMLLVAVLETKFLAGHVATGLTINPARGVDLPHLDLSVKSPSENYCTSEPYFSPYERIIGSEYDALVLLTDYQQAKKSSPLKLQILKSAYLHNSQLADFNLCRIALKYRELLGEDVSRLKRLVRFLAYVNQSDWRAAKLVQLLDGDIDAARINAFIAAAATDFTKKNAIRERKAQVPMPDSELEALQTLEGTRPPLMGIIDALDNWVGDTMKDFARMPSDNEWSRFENSDLDGQIGMSYALQWRFNFSRRFTGHEVKISDPALDLDGD